MATGDASPSRRRLSDWTGSAVSLSRGACGTYRNQPTASGGVASVSLCRAPTDPQRRPLHRAVVSSQPPSQPQCILFAWVASFQRFFAAVGRQAVVAKRKSQRFERVNVVAAHRANTHNASWTGRVDPFSVHPAAIVPV